MRTTPPAWAEAWLRVFLPPDYFASVSGDLLEQYRDSVLAARGLMGADWWYARQVAALVLRRSLPWAAFFAASFVARTALDWLRPTTDFHARSEVSTIVAAGLLLAAGFWTAWRSGSFAAGMASGLATTVTAAVLSTGGVVALLAIWHDAPTRAAIQGSGGLNEALVLPSMLILPGTILGSIGGLAGATARRMLR